MTEQRDMERFETRFADRVRAYTDPATERRIDALAISRTAISSRRAGGRWQRRLGSGLVGRRIAGVRWAVALVAVVLIGVVGVAVLQRTSNFGFGPGPTPVISPTSSPAAPTGGPVPTDLRHSWERPYAVTPDLDQWRTGFLSMATDLVDFGPEPGVGASKSAIAASGADALVATASAETRGCMTGDTGTYRWSLEGKGTVLTLTAISADACAAREEALAGPWVRSDLPTPPDGVPMEPGTYVTSALDLFGAPEVSGQLSYTVPDRWKVKEDRAGTFLLHHLPDDSAGPPSTDLFIRVFTQPRMVADYAEGATCGEHSDAPGVGRRVADIVAAIIARPGVVSTPPLAVTIGGYEGQMLDLQLARSWKGGCRAPDGPKVAMPILDGTEFEMGAGAGLDPNGSFRLILLDLTGGRTMAVAVFAVGPSLPPQLEEQVAGAMPVIESFEFHPPTP
jgi:hypothetical protein